LNHRKGPQNISGNVEVITSNQPASINDSSSSESPLNEMKSAMLLVKAIGNGPDVETSSTTFPVDNQDTQAILSISDDSEGEWNSSDDEINERHSVSTDSLKENPLKEFGNPKSPPKGVLWWPSKLGANVREMKELAQAENGGLWEEKATRRPDSNLCIFCRLFFDTWNEVVETLDNDHSIWSINVPFHENFQQMQRSASRGCELCAQFFIKHQKRSGRSAKDSSFSGAHLALYHAKTVSPTTGSADVWYLVLRNNLEERFRVILLVIPYKAFPSLLLSNMKPGSDHPLQKELMYLEDGRKSMVLAREWLKECIRNHSICSRRNKIRLPTRLLRIDKGKLHLCLSADLEDCLDYVTLSYCWGDANILRLLSGNLSLLLESIPYEDLSKTFRDAIEIARDMGFSFLWIDTLCIIQDDSNDWQRESACMAMTYGMSSLNIAASAAPDGNTGCFFPRDPTEFRPIKVMTNINSKQMTLELVDRDLVYINIDRAPLSRRAWVVQERVLAPRNLYFGVSQIFWECAQRSACETFPDTIPAQLLSQDTYLPKRALWHCWDRIASTYSAGSLTYPRDKSIAIAGIARRIHEETGYIYLAGLWEENLESQLCWMVETRKPHVQPHELRVTDIPSWSWLAVNAIVKVSLSTVLTVKLYIEVLSAVVTLDGAPVLDSFGFFNGGVLTIDTKYLLNCKVQSTHPLPEDSSPKRVCFAHTELVALVNWDYQDCYDPCTMLPVGQFNQYGGHGRILQECILLRPTGRKNGQYQRVGVLSVWPWSEPTDSLDTLLHGMFETPDHSDCTECIQSERDYQSVRFDDGNACYTITIV
jgi:hypothetical protein